MIAALKLAAPVSLYLGGTLTFFSALGGNVMSGLLLLVPLFPLQNIIQKLQILPLGKDFNDYLLLAMTIGWAISRRAKGERMADPTPLNAILVLYFFYTLFTLLIGSQYLHVVPWISLGDIRTQMWKNYAVFFLVYFLVVNNIRDTRQMKRLTAVMLFSMLLMDYYTIPQVRWMSGISSRVGLHGTFVNLGPNEVSAFYSTYSFVLLGLFLYERSPLRKAMLAGLIAVSVFCVLFMYSRAAYLALLSGVVFFSLMKNRLLLAPVIILVALWQAVLPMRVVERIKQTGTEENTLDPSAQKRLDIWHDAVAMFKQSPVVGVGFATLAVQGLRYGFADPHNIYLKMLTEQGVIGLLFLLLIFIHSFFAGMRLYNNADDGFLKGLGLGFALCVVATMVGNLFGNRWTHLQLGAFYWVFLAMVMRGNLITENNRRRKITNDQISITRQ